MQFGSHHFNNSKILQEALALFSFSSKLFSGPKKKKKKKKRNLPHKKKKKEEESGHH
jgi:hypothetical protein